MASQSSQLFGVDDCEAIKAVEHLMVKQNLEGTVAEFLLGYETEIQQMLRRRLRLLGPAEATRMSREYSLGKLRMLLELKCDGRKKARLILQGFREPLEWDEGFVASPVAFATWTFGCSHRVGFSCLHLDLGPYCYIYFDICLWHHLSFEDGSFS